MRSAHAQIAAASSGLLSISLLAAAWHATGWAKGGDPSYPVTSYFAGTITLAFVSAYIAVGLLLGAAWRQRWPVALGMIAPLPLALVYECVVDPTSHNLMPFEVLLLWAPAFAVALGAAALGVRMRGAPRAS